MFILLFQLFRETKENEIQTLLRARRDLENKLAKVSHGIPLEEGDNGSRIGLEMALGTNYIVLETTNLQ